MIAARTTKAAIFTTILLLLCTSTLQAKKPVEKDPDTVMRLQMLSISKQLGVTCAYCHDTTNFKSDKIAAFKIAKEHIRVVQWINGPQGWNKKPEVSCLTCHRGHAKPEGSAESSGTKH